MRKTGYMESLAELTGLQRCKLQEYSVELIHDPLIGHRDEYIIALGPYEESGYRRSTRNVRIFMRFKPVVTETLRGALTKCAEEHDKENLLLETGNCEHDFAWDIGEEPESEALHSDYLICNWRYSRSRPSPDRVSGFLDCCLTELKKIAPPLTRKCVMCDQTAISEISLRNGTPGYYCDSCKDREFRRLDKEFIKHQTMEIDYGRAIAYGVVAVLATSIAGAYLGALLHKKPLWPLLVCFASGLLVIPVAMAVKEGARRIDDKVAGMLLSMIVGQVAIGTILFYIFVAMQGTERPFDVSLLKYALDLFMQTPIRHTAEFLGLCFLCLLIGIQGPLRHADPRRKVIFESLEPKHGSVGRRRRLRRRY